MFCHIRLHIVALFLTSLSKRSLANLPQRSASEIRELVKRTTRDGLPPPLVATRGATAPSIVSTEPPMRIPGLKADMLGVEQSTYLHAQRAVATVQSSSIFGGSIFGSGSTDASRASLERRSGGRLRGTVLHFDQAPRGEAEPELGAPSAPVAPRWRTQPGTRAHGAEAGDPEPVSGSAAGAAAAGSFRTSEDPEPVSSREQRATSPADGPRVSVKLVKSRIPESRFSHLLPFSLRDDTGEVEVEVAIDGLGGSGGGMPAPPMDPVRTQHVVFGALSPEDRAAAGHTTIRGKEVALVTRASIPGNRRGWPAPPTYGPVPCSPDDAESFSSREVVWAALPVGTVLTVVGTARRMTKGGPEAVVIGSGLGNSPSYVTSETLPSLVRRLDGTAGFAYAVTVAIGFTAGVVATVGAAKLGQWAWAEGLAWLRYGSESRSGGAVGSRSGLP